MDNKYFEEQEKNCWYKLEEFNNEYHIFTDIDRQIKKHHSDGSGYTVNKLGEKRNFNIELKDRKQVLLDNGVISGTTDKGGYTADTIMIESHKVADLLLDNIIGLEPLYINFLQDGTIIIFNLNKLTIRPVISDVMNIKSKGYGKFEMCKRQFLNLKDAAIYKDGKLIKRAGEDFI